MFHVLSRSNAIVGLGDLFAHDPSRKKIACVAMGILGSLLWKSSSQRIVFAANDDSIIQHAIDEILSHAIWGKVGSVIGMSHFASGLLGGLLTFQQLGEKDSLHMPRAIAKPTATFAINPTTKKMEHCIILANGKQLFGQDIIKFYQGLQFIQFIPKEVK